MTNAHEILALMLVEEHGRIEEAEDAREPQVDRVVRAHRHVQAYRCSLFYESSQVRSGAVLQSHAAHLERRHLSVLLFARPLDAVVLVIIGEQMTIMCVKSNNFLT